MKGPRQGLKTFDCQLKRAICTREEKGQIIPAPMNATGRQRQSWLAPARLTNGSGCCDWEEAPLARTIKTELSDISCDWRYLCSACLASVNINQQLSATIGCLFVDCCNTKGEILLITTGWLKPFFLKQLKETTNENKNHKNQTGSACLCIVLETRRRPRLSRFPLLSSSAGWQLEDFLYAAPELAQMWKIASENTRM